MTVTDDCHCGFERKVSIGEIHFYLKYMEEKCTGMAAIRAINFRPGGVVVVVHLFFAIACDRGRIFSKSPG